MKSVRIVALVVLLAGVFLVAFSSDGLQVPASVKNSDDIAVVVNSRNQTSDLSTPELRSILLGERRFWKNQEPLKLVLREPGAPERDRVLAALLKMSNGEYGAHWRDKVFRGEASAPPLVVPSNGMASEFVFDTVGGITFVTGRNLRPDLKVLKVNGKLPGESGYLLK